MTPFWTVFSITALVWLALLWNLWPVLFLLTRKEIPWANRLEGSKSLMGAQLKCLLVVIPDMLSPFVVPIALLFTKREDNALPKLFAWWDNDASINGDREEYWDPNYQGVTYYANAHPRSFWARYVWLGWRNRASRLSQMLGHQWQPGDQDSRMSWGDDKTGRDHEGWAVNMCAGVYQLYRVAYLGRLAGYGWCLRTNVGHKVWTGYDARAEANVVNISVSILSWNGA